MKLRTWLVAGGLLLFWVVTAASAEEPPPTELRVVFIAYENPDQLVDDVGPVVTYLGDQLGIKIKHFVATDYAAKSPARLAAMAPSIMSASRSITGR